MKVFKLFLIFILISCNSSDIYIEPSSELYVKRVYNITPFEHSWSFYGESELKGSENNNTIVSFFKGIADWATDDEIPWCSAFMNHVHLASGYKYTGSLAARSWLDYGDKSINPVAGDIVVLWRESRSSWKGHVGFFIKYNNNKKEVLLYGGNQNNKASLKWYPTYRVLDYRKSVINPLCEQYYCGEDFYINYTIENENIIYEKF